MSSDNSMDKLYEPDCNLVDAQIDNDVFGHIYCKPCKYPFKIAQSLLSLKYFGTNGEDAEICRAGGHFPLITASDTPCLP